MDRRRFLAAAGAAATAAAAGCSASEGETGTLATQVTDQPGDIEDFEALVLRLTALRVPEGSGTETEGEEAEEGDDESEELLDIEDTEVDLTELAGGNTRLIDETELERGTYAYLKLVVDGVVEARLGDGGEATVTTPGEAPLKFDAEFEIRADERTTFVADFTPVRQGRAGRYILRPVADGVEVVYEDNEGG